MEFERKTPYAGWLIVLVGLLSTAVVTFYVSKKNAQEDQLRIEYEKNFILRRIQARMESYEGALIQTRAFVMNSPSINRDNLRNYISDTEIFRRYPGLQGLGVTVFLKKKDLKRHESELRKVIPDYRVWPAGEREVYSSIIVLEPSNRRNRRAMGYDMYSEPIRQRAMLAAIDSNSAIMSEKVVLVQEDAEEKFPGFNIYLPFYKKDSDTGTFEGRRDNVLGHIYSPFRTNELFSAIFNEMEAKLAVQIYLGNDQLYDSKNAMKGIISTDKIKLNGQELTLKFYVSDKFKSAQTLVKTMTVAVAGLLITLFLLWLYQLTRKQMMTARMLAEQNEKLFQKEKEHVEARDDFLSIASHELKTPLTSLKLQGDVMKRLIQKGDEKAYSKEKVLNLISHIENQTTRLTRLVDDMLDISRIRTGRLRIERAPMELCEVISDVIERLKPQFARNHIPAPSLHCGPKINGNWDRFRIEQVLTNLLTNAIRYGNGKPISIRVSESNGVAEIDVIDQGIGIAKENTGKIFERFERAGMTANEVSGLGLGLFITNQIVKAHHGKIEVESELGAGSTFKVYLPLEEKQNA